MLSSEFKAFEVLWAQDELNHYEGFRDIYSLFYGDAVKTVDDKMSARIPDFTSIAHFLNDEFTALVVLAYDEIATARAYQMDFSLYKKFGPKPLAEWIKLVAQDEFFHFDNVIEIIKACYSERVSEVSSIVKHLIDYDLSDEAYNSTFVLDHKGYYFSPDFLEKCGSIICARLSLPKNL